jgi:sugar lactone lactonase YvrE
MKNDRGGSKRVSTTLHVERYQKGGGRRNQKELNQLFLVDVLEGALHRIYEDHSSEGWQQNSPDGVVGWVLFGAPQEIF